MQDPETLKQVATECQNYAKSLAVRQNDVELKIQGKDVTKLVNILLNAGNLLEVVAREITCDGGKL